MRLLVYCPEYDIKRLLYTTMYIDLWIGRHYVTWRSHQTMHGIWPTGSMLLPSFRRLIYYIHPEQDIKLLILIFNCSIGVHMKGESMKIECKRIQEEEKARLCSKYLAETRQTLEIVEDRRLKKCAEHLISWFRNHTGRYVRKEISPEEYMAIVHKLGLWTGRIGWSDTDNQIRMIDLCIYTNTGQDYL